MPPRVCLCVSRARGASVLCLSVVPLNQIIVFTLAARGVMRCRALRIAVLMLAALAAADHYTCDSMSDRLTRLCGSATMPKDKVCTVSSAIVLPPHWMKCTFAMDGELQVLAGASVRCANQTERCAASSPFTDQLCGIITCELHFAFSNGISLGEGSSLRGGAVTLSSDRGRVSIGAGAVVDVSGNGLCGRDDVSSIKPYSQATGLGNGGAGHGGNGGSCSERTSVPGEMYTGSAFGDATDVIADLKSQGTGRPQDPDLMRLYGTGSALSRNQFHAKQQCCGGGLILINASKGLQLDGVLQSNAQAPCTTDASQCPTYASAIWPVGTQRHDGQHGQGWQHGRGHWREQTRDEQTRIPLRQRDSEHLPCCDASLVLREAQCSGLGGASGGTVAVIAGHGAAPPLNGTGAVYARGGDASAYLSQPVSSPTAGGAGGRVLLPLCSVLPADPATSGGYSSDGECGVSSECECGAAGTIFYAECDAGFNRLIVDNGGRDTSAGSYLIEASRAAKLVVDDLQVINGAQLNEHPGRNLTTRRRITLKENARLRLRRGQGLSTGELVIASAEIVGSFEVVDGAFEDVQHAGERARDAITSRASALRVGSLAMDPLSKVAGVTSWTVVGDASVQGHVEVLAGEVTMHVGGRLRVDALGSISAVALSLNASEAFVQGHVESTRSVSAACPPYRLDCTAKNASAWPKGCEYPLRLDVDRLVVGSDGVIAGGAMRICARRVTVADGQITASVLGHSAGFGPVDAPGSHGCVAPPPAGASADSGAGSGAAHGGSGGAAASFENVTGCQGGTPYDDPFSPGDMGAGGGGEKGGQGGGVLHLSASESLELDGYGQIAADGASAAPALSSMGLRPERGEGGGGDETDYILSFIEGGSGGGSGGSIVLEVGAIAASASSSIHARGGNGAAPGGGGGGGGLIRIQPPRGKAAWATPLSPDLLNSISAVGGVGGGGGGVPGQRAGADGGDAVFVTLNCSKGHAGSLCTPCAIGSFKGTRGPSACSLCGPGTFASEPGSSQCLACASGTVALKPGQANCSSCPIGSLADGATSCPSCSTLGHPLPRFARYVRGCDWQCEWPRVTDVFEPDTCVVFVELLLPSAVGGSLLLFVPALVASAILVWIVIIAPEAGRRAHAKSSTSGRECAQSPREDASSSSSVQPRQMGHRPSSIVEEGTLDAAHDSTPGRDDRRGVLARGGVRHGAHHRLRQHTEPLLTAATNAGAGAGTDGEGPVDLGGRDSPSQLAPPSMESLRHALMWETHKYRAKQHVLRVYLTGWNSAMHPWRLPPLTPELRMLVSESAYWRIAEQFGHAAEWRQWEVIVASLLWLLPPLAVQFITARRRVHWERVSRLMQSVSGDKAGAEGSGLWRSMYSRVWEAHRLELGCSHEFTLGWVDIFANVSAHLPASIDSNVSSPLASDGGPGAVHTEDAANGRRGGGIRSITADAIGAEAIMRVSCRSYTPVPPPQNSPVPSFSAECGAAAQGSQSGSSHPTHPTRPTHPTHPTMQQQLAWQPQLRPPSLQGHHQPSSRAVRRGPLSYPDPESPASAINLRQPSRNGHALPSASSRVREEGDGPMAATMEGEHGEGDGDAFTYDVHRLSYCLAEPRVAHEVRVCGFGTILSPYWVEVDDFFVYNAFSTGLDASAATVATCINLHLRSVMYHNQSWRRELRALLELLDALNEQQLRASVAQNAGARSHGTLAQARQPHALALARAASTASRQDESSSEETSAMLVLLLGAGEPNTWAMPEGATILTPESVESLAPPAGWSHEMPYILGCPVRVLFGTIAPLPHEVAACSLLLLLLTTELILTILVTSGLCQLSETAGACAATVLCMPFAGLISPFAGLQVVALIVASRRGARKAREKALRDSASGRLVRSLQLGALWNAASLPNTILAQIFFLPFAASEGRSAYHVVLLALLPTSLLTTKLLIAQAFKVLGASLGVDQTVWTLLVRLGRQSRHAFGRLAADAPPGSQSADAPSMEEDPQAASGNS